MEKVRVKVVGAGSLSVQTEMSPRELLVLVGLKLKADGIDVQEVKKSRKKKAVPAE